MTKYVKTYKIGQEIKTKKSTAWIGCDRFAHYLSGDMKPIPKSWDVFGYDIQGIVDRIYIELIQELSFKDITVDPLILEAIKNALHGIGMW